MATRRAVIGGTTVTVKTYETGIEHMLADAMMLKGTHPHAEAIKARAEASAPEETGEYKSSFGVQDRLDNPANPGHGHGSSPRFYTQVYNSVHHAMYVEWGNRYTPPYRTLRKAAGQIDYTNDKGIHGG